MVRKGSSVRVRCWAWPESSSQSRFYAWVADRCKLRRRNERAPAARAAFRCPFATLEQSFASSVEQGIYALQSSRLLLSGSLSECCSHAEAQAANGGAAT